MSGFGNTKESILPEDIEIKLANVQRIISELGDLKLKIEDEVAQKRKDLEVITAKVEVANNELSTLNALYETKSLELKTKEEKVTQRESALDVYANALQEKEKKTNKYLSIFENMKDVISK